MTATGQNFVRITLMTDIPNQLVHRGVENSVQRYGQLDHTQRGSQMPPGFGNHLDHFVAQLTCQHGKFRILHVLQVRRTDYAIKVWCGCRFASHSFLPEEAAPHSGNI